MYLSTFLKNEYLTSTCTWYIFGVLGVLEYLSTVLDPNPARDPYFYVPLRDTDYVIKLSCSRKVLAAGGD